MTQPSYDELRAEIERLKHPPQPGSHTTTLVWACISLCVVAATFVVAMTLVRPAADNTPLILMVLGVVVPVITALLAAAVQQVHLAVNSRLSQLLMLTATSSRAEGELYGLMQPTPGTSTARAEGRAAGVEQERVRAEQKPDV
jgi:hypothetical protein